ncbi:MAG: response regulator [Anaerolineales bacterium]|nr:response regulator [Anaerolineales bacterium]
MTAKRILLVDDQREVTRFLRSALETLNREDIIVEVPSGEEALLEIGRGGADLLVIDVRLPGISGLEVVRRLRRANSRAPVIVISGVADERLEAEAQNLGVLAFLHKPLKINTFLPLAQRVLEAPTGALEAPPPEQNEPAISERLSTLRRDLGADAVFLVDMQATIAVRAGDITDIDLDPLMAEVVTAMAASLNASRMVGGLIPTNIHFFDGDEYDVYAVNVGQYYSIVIVFDGERGAGQMGPVMRYGRQCADDLLNSLVMLGVKTEATSAFAPHTTAPLRPATAPLPPLPTPPAKAVPAAAAVSAPARAVPTEPPAPPVVEKPLTEAELQALEQALADLKNQDANAFWDNLGEVEIEPVRADALSFEEAAKLGLVEKK